MEYRQETRVKKQNLNVSWLYNWIWRQAKWKKKFINQWTAFSSSNFSIDILIAIQILRISGISNAVFLYAVANQQIDNNQFKFLFYRYQSLSMESCWRRKSGRRLCDLSAKWRHQWLFDVSSVFLFLWHIMVQPASAWVIPWFTSNPCLLSSPFALDDLNLNYFY